MLRGILSAIGRALRGVLAAIWSLAGLPGRLLGGLFGGLFGGAMEPPPAGDGPLVSELREELAGRRAAVDNDAKTARMVLLWCADSIVADRPAPVPSSLPREIREWIKGLTREECEVVIASEKTAISAHIRKLKTLAGVRAVQPLPPVEWTPAPVSMEPAPDFALAATPWPGAR